MDCEARDAGSELAALLRRHGESREPLAFILGGETVVKLTGCGKGGRNQELALSAAAGIAGMAGAAVFPWAPTAQTAPRTPRAVLWTALPPPHWPGRAFPFRRSWRKTMPITPFACVDGLIFTGPTGTNVNDLSVALLRPESTPEGNHRT